MGPPPLKVRAEMGTEKRIFTFTTGFLIGRTDECEVCIKNEHVSRKHVEVVFENGNWLVRDLESANGIYVGDERVQSVPLVKALRIRLGIRGPFVEFIVQAPAAGTGVTKAATHYFGNPEDPSVGEQTRVIRRAFAEVQTKQKRKYTGIIAGVMMCALAAGGYAFYLHHETQKNRAEAQEMFYTMKAIDVQIANVEKIVAESGNKKAAEQAATLRGQRDKMHDSYNRRLASLKLYDPKMTEEEKLVLKVSRIFGECELDMPKDFFAEVRKYIQYWKSTGRYLQAIRLAKEKGYNQAIANEFLSQDLPPQFFYLAMQESGFKEYAVGPKTYAGYAKGMWQFIPTTAANYGLKLGPLVDADRPDPGDDRHHWDRETKAAAAYIKDLYRTDAQASGLLVMACYNWGEKSVLPLVKSIPMPDNPRERNFWKLLALHRDKIPDETYNYVFYIVSAAVIGENPKLFGMDCDNPLSGF